MPVPEWLSRLHSRYASSDAAPASSADKGDLMARSSFKKTKASPFGGNRAAPFGKKDDSKKPGRSAPAQKSLRSGASMRGPR